MVACGRRPVVRPPLFQPLSGPAGAEEPSLMPSFETTAIAEPELAIVVSDALAMLRDLLPVAQVVLALHDGGRVSCPSGAEIPIEAFEETVRAGGGVVVVSN